VEATLNMRAVKKIWFPKEHGAWAMTFSPIVSGFMVAGAVGWTGAWLFLSVLMFFLLRQPAVTIVRGIKNRRKVNASVGLLFAAELLMLTAAGLIVLRRMPRVEWLGFGALAAFSLLAYLFFVSRRKEMTAPAEVVTVSGVCIGAPAGYFAATGRLDDVALALLLLNLAYFVPNIFYIRLKARVQARRNPPDSWQEYVKAGLPLLAYNALGWVVNVAGAMAGVMQPLALVALVPNTLKDIWAVARWHTRSELDIRRRGWMEVAHLFLFLALVKLLVG